MQKVIGIVGENGAGKTTLGSYLKENLGYEKVEISDVLKKIAKNRGIELSRKNLIALGASVEKEEGDDYLVKVVLEENQDAERLCIVGMRQFGQLTHLENLKNSNKIKLLLVGLTADQKVRFERMKSRGKLGDTTREDFLDTEKLDNAGPVQNIQKCLNNCSPVLRNDGKIDDLIGDLDKLIEEM